MKESRSTYSSDGARCTPGTGSGAVVSICAGEARERQHGRTVCMRPPPAHRQLWPTSHPGVTAP